MKKLVKLFIVTLIALTVTACQNDSKNGLEKILDKGVVTVATSPDYAPYEFIDPTKSGDDKYVGADIEFAKYIAKELGVELKIDAVDFNTVLGNIAVGTSDLGIAGISIDEERKKSMDFTEAYDFGELSSKHSILVLKENVNQYNDLTSFNGKVVAAQAASLQESFAKAQLTGATIEQVADLNNGILMLQTNKVDGLSVSVVSAEQMLTANDDLALVPFFYESDENEGGTSVAVKKGEDELVARLNEIIVKVKEEKLYEQWVIEAKALQKSLGIE